MRSSLALGIYIASNFKLMRVGHFAFSIIELWIFQLLNFANGNGNSTRAPDAPTPGYYATMRHSSRRHLGETGAFATLSSLDIIVDLTHLSRHTLVALADKSSV